MNLLVKLPLEINISPDLQLIKASTIANRGIPRINGCHPISFLGVKIINSTRYSQEYKDKNTSSNTPSSLITNLSDNCNSVGVY